MSRKNRGRGKSHDLNQESGGNQKPKRTTTPEGEKDRPCPVRICPDFAWRQRSDEGVGWVVPNNGKPIVYVTLLGETGGEEVGARHRRQQAQGPVEQPEQATRDKEERKDKNPDKKIHEALSY